MNTESEFMARLRELRDRSGLSIRALAAATGQSRSTLADTLARNTLPGNENQMRVLLIVLLRAVPGEPGLDDHLADWRHLIGRRHHRNGGYAPLDRILLALDVAEQRGGAEVPGLRKAREIVLSEGSLRKFPTTGEYAANSPGSPVPPVTSPPLLPAPPHQRRHE
ncbi:helix-turn-helix domain-containing protein [Amycolatopsis alba]|uniref:helix-turn-helix domain-containing protein n=1 Tax=Amycolatopsis alba TaxID=76020 RepID=UPI0003A67EF3|nr:helix-turn-helix transcriptional regulator [Amycolatopsis alba]